ncbi:hypothetical protein ACSNOI_46650 [Actinomadura kijaniata]|uniref:hypothetical protein n=1 Tax=Actinomadura kijaniata TaxID=46161 RepID=UPI003F1B6CEF
MVTALAAVPAPGLAPGSHLPGLQAAAAHCHDGKIVAVTRLAHAVPGHPDGQVDTRPLRPIWQCPHQPAWTEPWNNQPPTLRPDDRHH